jgi:hypothetical protein
MLSGIARFRSGSSKTLKRCEPTGIQVGMRETRANQRRKRPTGAIWLAVILLLVDKLGALLERMTPLPSPDEVGADFPWSSLEPPI